MVPVERQVTRSDLRRLTMGPEVRGRHIDRRAEVVGVPKVGVGNDTEGQ